MYYCHIKSCALTINHLIIICGLLHFPVLSGDIYVHMYIWSMRLTTQQHCTRLPAQPCIMCVCCMLGRRGPGDRAETSPGVSSWTRYSLGLHHIELCVFLVYLTRVIKLCGFCFTTPGSVLDSFHTRFFSQTQQNLKAMIMHGRRAVVLAAAALLISFLF